MKNLLALSLFALVIIFSGCSKNGSNVTPKKTDTTINVTTGTISGGTGVYIAGYEAFYKGADTLTVVSANVPNVAKVWKDGKAVNLTDGKYDAEATAVFANATDVYVAGYEKNSAGFKVATVWKNGVAGRLGDGKEDSYANSITVDGTNVYVAGNVVGSSVTVGTLWKNGAGSALTNCEAANSVAVFSGKVYVCGSDNNIIPNLWVNGTATKLLGAGVGVPNYIAIAANGERYIAGDFENNGTVAGYWNNEKFKLLGNIPGEGYGSGEIKSVATDGADVYLLGFNDLGPVLWKNEVPKQVYFNADPAPGDKTYYGNSLIGVAKSTDVLMTGWRTSSVVGSYTHNVDRPLLWTNTTGSLLDNGDSDAVKKLYPITGGKANAICVVK